MRAWGRGLLVIAAAAAWLAGLTAPASANVFALDGQDPRAPSPRTGDGRLYAPVGTITTRIAVPASDDGTRQIRTRGSAFLVSPCYVLTNYHAVFGLAFDGPDAAKDYSATFSVGADPDFVFRWQVTATPVRWGAFNRRKEHDWALLKLDGCVGGQPDVGWLGISAQPGAAMLGQDVALAGYPADKALTTLWLQPNCKIEAMQEGTAKVLHACSVKGGASGGPLIEKASAVAIQCGELNASDSPLSKFDVSHANTAVTIAEVFEDEEAKALIDADIAAFPGANPARGAVDAPAPDQEAPALAAPAVTAVSAPVPPGEPAPLLTRVSAAASLP